MYVGLAEAQAQEVFNATGVKGRLVVHVGCGDGKLTAALRANTSYLVHGLDADSASVETARACLQAAGLYGHVAVDRWTGGRLFYIVDEGPIAAVVLEPRWQLVACDAFNGVFLWKLPMPKWGHREWNTIGLWSAPLTLTRRLITDGDRVFATLGCDAPLSVLDGATGREIRTIPESQGTDEIVLSDGVLLLCVRGQLSVAEPPKDDASAKAKAKPKPMFAPTRTNGI